MQKPEIIDRGEISGDGLITEEEKKAARHCMDKALELGAGQARVSLSKSVMDSYSLLNGELDKVMHSADRSIFIYLFAEGKYGTFSTNMLDTRSLDGFISKALETVRMLAPDRFRQLPSPERTARDAVSGKETGLYDQAYPEITSERKLSAAMSGSMLYNDKAGGIAGSCRETDRYSIISEECEYSDSVDDNYTADSQGFEGRHMETSFAFCSELTIQDNAGNIYSGYWWESSPFLASLDVKDCSKTALERAIRQIGPKRHRSGKFRMVVDRTVSSRLVSPLFNALNAMSIQQKNSFLEDSLGRKVFSSGLTIMDLARTPGKPGSRLYDTEGVATSDSPVIQEGTVKEYFTNTYMAGKTGLEPTVEGVSRPVLMPYSSWDSKEKEISLQAVLESCGNGIYVCGFNGGNCNPVTGDFSYGIEGFAFRNGKISHPVREMLVTGNMITLWNSLLAAGSDARGCSRWQIPTLAFDGVDFSA